MAPWRAGIHQKGLQLAVVLWEETGLVEDPVVEASLHAAGARVWVVKRAMIL